MTAWAFAFPLNALAAAAVTMYGLSPHRSMMVSGYIKYQVITLGLENKQNNYCRLVLCTSMGILFGSGDLVSTACSLYFYVNGRGVPLSFVRRVCRG